MGVGRGKGKSCMPCSRHLCIAAINTPGQWTTIAHAHPLGRGGRPLSGTAGAPPVRVTATAAARSRRPAKLAMAMWGAGEVAVSAGGEVGLAGVG